MDQLHLMNSRFPTTAVFIQTRGSNILNARDVARWGLVGRVPWSLCARERWALASHSALTKVFETRLGQQTESMCVTTHCCC